MHTTYQPTALNNYCPRCRLHFLKIVCIWKSSNPSGRRWVYHRGITTVTIVAHYGGYCGHTVRLPRGKSHYTSAHTNYQNQYSYWQWSRYLQGLRVKGKVFLQKTSCTSPIRVCFGPIPFHHHIRQWWPMCSWSLALIRTLQQSWQYLLSWNPVPKVQTRDIQELSKPYKV